MENMKFLLASRSKDTDEDVSAWREEVEEQLQALYDDADTGVNVIVVSAKEAWAQHKDNGGRWNDYAQFITQTKVEDDWRYDGVIVPLAGDEGPTWNDAFVGKPTAEIIEMAQSHRRGDDEMFVYVALPFEDGAPKGTGLMRDWEFYAVTRLVRYQAPKGRKSPPFKRWAELKFDGGE